MSEKIRAAELAWLDPLRADLAALGVTAHVHAVDIDGGGQVSVRPDELVPLASTFKILVVLELCRQAAAGECRLDEAVTVPVEGRTWGAGGLSAMADPVTMSLRDLALMALSISDNAATDVVLRRVGVDRVNATAAELGLTGTSVAGTLSDVLDEHGRQLGYGNLAELIEAEREPRNDDPADGEPADGDPGIGDPGIGDPGNGDPSNGDPSNGDASHPEPGDRQSRYDAAEVERRLRASDLVNGRNSFTGTARDLTRLLAMIWRDEAGAAVACAQTRELLRHQIGAGRIASGFTENDVEIASKTGTLPYVRNECGVVELPDGGRYAVAVLTRTADHARRRPAHDLLIGRLARAAVDAVRAPREVIAGGVNTLIRLGGTVRRPVDTWTPAVHALLRHLAAEGFAGAPRAHGVDPDGREMVDFIAGDVYPAGHPGDDDCLAAAARLLRRYHDASAGFAALGVHGWQFPAREPVEVICHGDVAPYNCVFRDGLPVALIDFDTAHPGPRLWDAGYAAYRFIPLSATDDPVVLAEQSRRLRLFCDAYGTAHTDAVNDAHQPDADQPDADQPDAHRMGDAVTVPEAWTGQDARTGRDTVPAGDTVAAGDAGGCGDARESAVAGAAADRLRALVGHMRQQAAAGHPSFRRHLAAGHDRIYEADIAHLTGPPWSAGAI